MGVIGKIYMYLKALKVNGQHFMQENVKTATIIFFH